MFGDKYDRLLINKVVVESDKEIVTEDFRNKQDWDTSWVIYISIIYRRPSAMLVTCIIKHMFGELYEWDDAVLGWLHEQRTKIKK